MLAFVTAMAVAAILGVRSAPTEDWLDDRRSTYLSGPHGTKGFADALEALGVSVEQRRRSLFDINDDSSQVLPVIAMLDVGFLPTRVERQALMRYVERGGNLLLVGWNGVERCLGFEPEFVEEDSVALRFADGLDLPDTEVVIREAVDEPEEGRARSFDPRALPCVPAPLSDVDTLLTTVTGESVALRMNFASGAHALLIAEPRFVSNLVLKETDIGIPLLSWLLDLGVRHVVVDEYHQGFGDGGSVTSAAWRWMAASPAGWVMLQLVGAGLLFVFVSAVRFGPTVQVIERRRRSPLEHLDALATGLERAHGRDAAAALLAAGLRRRLAGGGVHHHERGQSLDRWLESLSLAARNERARGAVQRLGTLLRGRDGDEGVLAIATTVEDVWEALRPTERPRKS
jgi:hypothetical protein